MDEEYTLEPGGESLHSLLTTFVDTTPGGGTNVLLQESGSALLLEDSSYIILE